MFDSVRVRLTLLYTGVLALILIFLSAGTYWLVALTMERRTYISMAEISQGFLATLQSEYKGQLKERAGPETLHVAALEAGNEFRLRDHRFAVLDSAGNVLAENQALPVPQEPDGTASQPEIPAEVLRHLAGRRQAEPARSSQLEIPAEVLRHLIAGTAGAPRRLQDLMLGGEHFRARVLQGKVGGSAISIVTLQSVEAERLLLEDIRRTLFWMIPVMLLIASAIGYFLARKSLAPVVVMSEKAAHMGAQNLNERLPVLNPRDELGHLASTFNDLLERLNRSFEQQRRFMADASHELRSPVSIIRGEAEVALSRARTPEEYRGSLAIALDEARRLSQIVDDLFTLARADAGQYPLRPRDFYLEELAVECVRAARSMAAARSLTLRYEPDGEMPIHGDELLVRRLTMNLLDNAIKYTAEGGIALKIGPHQNRLRFLVEDTGIGIRPEQLPKIFESFHQVRDPSTFVEGTGLGLAISRTLVSLMGGTLEVASTPGEGSRFWFDLLLPAVPLVRESPERQRRSIIGVRGARRRLLVVDDKEDNRALVRDLLSPLGFEILEAEDAQACLRLAASARPDAILLDLRMPGVDGLEATRRLRALPGTRDLVIIAVSASAFEQHREECLEAGANDFLAKPFRLDRLLDILRALLGIEVIYADAPAAGPSASAGDARGLERVVPPAAELDGLLDLARRGHIKQILAESQRLEAVDARYALFVAEVRVLTEQFQVKKLCQLLERARAEA